MHLDMLISGNPLCAGMLEELQEHVESIDMANGMCLGLYHINVNQPVNLFLLHHSLNDPFLDGDMTITLFGRRNLFLLTALFFISHLPPFVNCYCCWRNKTTEGDIAVLDVWPI